MFMSAFNVKVRVLYRDWLICETYSREYNNNTKGERKRKNCNLKFKSKRDFLQKG